MNSTVVSTIVGIVILAAIFAYIFFRYKKSNDAKAQAALKEFEDNIKGTVEDFIIKYIDATDFSKFNGLTDAQMTILNDLYNKVWDLVTDELTKLSTTDPMSATLIKKVLTRENVEAFTKTIYDSYKPQAKFAQKYDANIKANVEEAVALEKQTFKEGRDYDEGAVKSEFKTTVFDENQEKVEEEKSKLNPPKDEETEVYSKDDDSVEVIDDNLDKYADTVGDFYKEDKE